MENLKPQSLEARIGFLKEVQGLLKEERALLQDADEAADAAASQTLQDRARNIYREYAPLLRGTPEEVYLETFVSDYMPNKMLISDMPLEDLGLSVGTYNILHNAEVQYAGEIREKGETWLLRITGFGRKGLKEVKEIFSEKGLPLDGKTYVTPKQRLEKKLDMPVDEFCRKYYISLKTENVLSNRILKAGPLRTVYIGEVVQRRELEWLREMNFGRQALKELNSGLEQEGLYLGMPEARNYQPPK